MADTYSVLFAHCSSCIIIPNVVKMAKPFYNGHYYKLTLTVFSLERRHIDTESNPSPPPGNNAEQRPPLARIAQTAARFGLPDAAIERPTVREWLEFINATGDLARAIDAAHAARWGDTTADEVLAQRAPALYETRVTNWVGDRYVNAAELIKAAGLLLTEGLDGQPLNRGMLEQHLNVALRDYGLAVVSERDKARLSTLDLDRPLDDY